jgi:septum formation inhibitor MinC
MFIFIEDEDHLFCLHGPKALQTARAIRYFASRQKPERDGLASCMAAKLNLEQGTSTGQRPSHLVMRPVRSPSGVRTKQQDVLN